MGKIIMDRIPLNESFPIKPKSSLKLFKNVS